MNTTAQNHKSFLNALARLHWDGTGDRLQNEIETLAEAGESPCISVYLPLHRRPDERHKNDLQWRQAAKDLEAQPGWERFDDERQAAVRSRLEELAETDLTRRLQGAGVALFVASGTDRLVDLPVAAGPRVTLASAFDLIPLADAWYNDQSARLLELTQHRVRLYDVDRWQLQERALPDAPDAIQDLLGVEVNEFHLQFHTGTDPSPHGRRDAVYHSQGGRPEVKKDKVKRLCQAVDNGLRADLRDTDKPLILAGVGYVLDMFREVTHYPNICTAEIHGNPERLATGQLHDKAREILTHHLQQNRREAVSAFAEVPGDNRLTGDLDRVLADGAAARLEALFLPADRRIWGQPATIGGKPAARHEKPEPGDDELLTVAAARTLQTGGTVIPVPAAEVPGVDSGDDPVAGLRRY